MLTRIRYAEMAAIVIRLFSPLAGPAALGGERLAAQGWFKACWLKRWVAAGGRD